VIRARVPEGETIAYLGMRGDYWALANPILYYTERMLDAPSATAEEALRAARERRSGLLVQRSRLGELPAAGYTVVLERPEWVMVQLPF
jgi:hypothetical protein